MSLSIILATRGRPQLLLPTVRRTLTNIKRPDTKLVIAVDADDKPTLAAHARGELEGTIVSVLPREDSLGEKYNNRMAVAPADVYLVMVDYAEHITPGFDQKLLDAASVFPDRIGVIYNHLANRSFPEINAVTHRMAELMGGIYPPHFSFWFVDHWLDDIARLTDRIAFCDVRIDASRRPGTMERREPYWWATFFDALWPERATIATRIIDVLEEPAWRKRLLKERFPLSQQRSQRINNVVRGMDWNSIDPDVDIDARYTRIKARAIEIVRPYVERALSAPVLTEA